MKLALLEMVPFLIWPDQEMDEKTGEKVVTSDVKIDL